MREEVNVGDRDKPDRPPMPADLILDPLTSYIFRHYGSLLTARERAAERFRVYRAKSLGQKAGGDFSRNFWLGKIEQDFPDLVEQCEREGPNTIMVAARDRVLREHAADIVLNTCPSCGQLCRTPRARQCLGCGHDWHPETSP